MPEEEIVIQQGDDIKEEIKSPLLYYYKWYVKYADGKTISHFDTIDDFINNRINKFGEISYNGLTEIGLLPLRDGVKPIVVDLKPFKHASYKKPIYWRKRVFCSGNHYPPFHVYIVGYEINIDNKNITFSICAYPNGTVEITDKKPQNINLFIENLKKNIGGNK